MDRNYASSQRNGLDLTLVGMEEEEEEEEEEEPTS